MEVVSLVGMVLFFVLFLVFLFVSVKERSKLCDRLMSKTLDQFKKYDVESLNSDNTKKHISAHSAAIKKWRKTD